MQICKLFIAVLIAIRTRAVRAARAAVCAQCGTCSRFFHSYYTRTQHSVIFGINNTSMRMEGVEEGWQTRHAMIPSHANGTRSKTGSISIIASSCVAMQTDACVFIHMCLWQHTCQHEWYIRTEHGASAGISHRTAYAIFRIRLVHWNPCTYPLYMPSDAAASSESRISSRWSCAQHTFARDHWQTHVRFIERSIHN